MLLTTVLCVSAISGKSLTELSAKLLKLCFLQRPSDKQQDLQRRIEAIGKEMDEMRRELKALQNNSPSDHQTAGGVRINLQVIMSGVAHLHAIPCAFESA